MDAPKGFIVEVYRRAGKVDPTMLCLSDRVEQVTLFGKGLPDMHEVTKERPAMMVIDRKAMGYSFPIAVPIGKDGKPVLHLPFSGNFLYDHDSRFREVAGVGVRTIPCFDWEGG